MKPALVAGLDGCRSGWICLLKTPGSAAVEARHLQHVSELLCWRPQLQQALIDVPIGLASNGQRRCDVAARARLGKLKAASVFSAPIRPMLAATSHAQACEIGRASLHGRALSIQAWGIVPKISAVDQFLQEDTTRKGWLREVHPEVSFQALNQGAAMSHPKRRPDGRAERSMLLQTVFGEVVTSAAQTLRQPGVIFAHDDLLDAFAALWTAERVFNGKAYGLPDEPETDDCGLPMQIWA